MRDVDMDLRLPGLVSAYKALEERKWERRRGASEIGSYGGLKQR